MVEDHWDVLRGREIRYRDHTWELTGDVRIRDAGAGLSVDAVQVDDVRHGRATLHFDLRGSADSLNPGNLGAQFSRLEREDGEHRLVVETAGGRYRYVLNRLAFE